MPVQGNPPACGSALKDTGFVVQSHGLAAVWVLVTSVRHCAVCAAVRLTDRARVRACARARVCVCVCVKRCARSHFQWQCHLETGGHNHVVTGRGGGGCNCS